MKRKKAAGLFCIVFTLVCLFLSGRANNDLGLFSDTHSTAGIIPEYVREGTSLSFLLLAVALAVSLICFCLYQYKKVPGAVAVAQLVIVLTICVYSLFMSILCICCMNGYRTEGLTASGSPAVSGSPAAEEPAGETAQDETQTPDESREADSLPPVFMLLPQKTVETIQINGVKNYPPAGTAEFDAFLEDLTSIDRTDQAENGEIRRGKDYLVVTLGYGDGEKANLFFFRPETDGENWYLQTGDGRIFGGADFITDYVNIEAAASAPEMRESFALYLEPDELKKSAELTGQLKELGVSFGTEDMRALFADEMRTQRKRWEKEQEALEAAAEELTWRMDRYQYALQKGYAPTEEEIDGRLEEITARIREAPNFAELETALKECGTTCEQYLQDRRELYRISLAEEKLYAAAYEEFRLGNDRIGDRVCGDFTEYWTYYLLDVVYPAMESYNETPLEPPLKEAEAFYIRGWNGSAKEGVSIETGNFKIRHQAGNIQQPVSDKTDRKGFPMADSGHYD